MLLDCLTLYRLQVRDNNEKFLYPSRPDLVYCLPAALSADKGNDMAPSVRRQPWGGLPSSTRKYREVAEPIMYSAPEHEMSTPENFRRRCLFCLNIIPLKRIVLIYRKKLFYPYGRCPASLRQSRTVPEPGNLLFLRPAAARRRFS
jgi:hypothetical protein